MSMHIYIGNLHSTTSPRDLHALCRQFGTVLSVQLATEADTGASRGFAFVEMADGANAALEVLQSYKFHGRVLTVHQAEATKQGVRDGKSGHSVVKT